MFSRNAGERVKVRATIPPRRRVFNEGEQQSGLQDVLSYHN
jgi:hypothetical protein